MGRRSPQRGWCPCPSGMLGGTRRAGRARASGKGLRTVRPVTARDLGPPSPFCTHPERHVCVQVLAWSTPTKVNRVACSHPTPGPHPCQLHTCARTLAHPFLRTPLSSQQHPSTATLLPHTRGCSGMSMRWQPHRTVRAEGGQWPGLGPHPRRGERGTPSALGSSESTVPAHMVRPNPPWMNGN